MSSPDRLRPTKAQLSCALKAATARLDYLEGWAAATGLDLPPVAPILAPLSPQCRALVGLLAGAKGQVVPVARLAARMPTRSMSAGHAPDCVKAHVFKVRRALGSDAIQTVPGEGYRLGAGLLAALTAKPPSPSMTHPPEYATHDA